MGLCKGAGEAAVHQLELSRPQPALLVGRNPEIGDEFPVMRQHGILTPPVVRIASSQVSGRGRALAIREKVLGPEHPEMATSLNNLAPTLPGRGRSSKRA